MSSAVPQDVTAALGALSSGYREVFARLLDVVEPDLRVRALWVAGSLGRGVADAGSDLDVVVTVSDESFDGFCQHWRDWLATVTPTIIAREIPGLTGSFYSVTPGCERLDVVVERVADVETAPAVWRLVVLDRDGLSGRARPALPAAAGPDATKVSAIVEEFFRQQAIFPAAVVARRDWLLGVVGVVTTQRLLYDLFVEANQPLPMMGIKQWSSRLSATQRALLESLPVPNPRRDEVVSAMLAVRRAMLTAGRDTAEHLGVVWPTRLDAAVADYYVRELGASAPPGSSASSASLRSTSPTTRIAVPGE